MPSSKIRVGIAGILKAKGYISSFELTEVREQVGKMLKVTPKYGDSCERPTAGLRRTSKLSLHVYVKTNALPKVLGGLGTAIISTSQGLLTDRQASAKSAGDEVPAYIW